MEGTMIWFNPAKRHGFIRTDEGERLRVEESGFAAGALLGDRCGGTRVRFERIAGAPDEARAVSVTLVPLMVARRARARGRR
jgi:cold shock CspA family protein